MKQSPEFDKTGQWDLTIRHTKSDQVTKHTFDAVLVCTGHHAEISKPSFPGMDTFNGNVIHSHDYKDFHGYEGKRVVVVGIGNSGVDVAVELSRVASQVRPEFFY